MSKEVLKEFKLLPEEAVIKRTGKVGPGTVTIPNPFMNDELILTDQAITYIKKDLFGKVKEVTRYPLADICLSGGKPQVVKGSGDNVSGYIDIYFEYETLHLKLEWRSDAEEWIAAITETITGEKAPEKDPFEDFEKFVAFADSINGTVKDIKKTFGIKSTEQVACKCASCGASLSGTEDEVVVCPYCGTSNKMVQKSATCNF